MSPGLGSGTPARAGGEPGAGTRAGPGAGAGAEPRARLTGRQRALLAIRILRAALRLPFGRTGPGAHWSEASVIGSRQLPAPRPPPLPLPPPRRRAAATAELLLPYGRRK